MTEDPRNRCAAEIDVAREFPELHTSFARHPLSRPGSDEAWKRTLRVARNSAPILADLRERGLNLVRLDEYTPPGTDREPLYRAVIDLLPRLQDPLTLYECLSRLTEPGARSLVKKQRELLLNLARQWNQNQEPSGIDHEPMLSALSRCLMKAVLERDVPEVVEWARDRRLPWGARANYVFDLHRFAKKPGRARDTLIELLADGDVGNSAVWALAGALKDEVLPLLLDLRVSSPHAPVRAAAKTAVRKLEARSSKTTLPQGDPAMLPLGYGSTSIEIDAGRFPELLSSLERAMECKLQPGIGQQLALSAAQVRRRHRRFHTVQSVFENGATREIGFGLRGEDEDVIVVEVYSDQEFLRAVRMGLEQMLDNDTA